MRSLLLFSFLLALSACTQEKPPETIPADQPLPAVSPDQPAAMPTHLQTPPPDGQQKRHRRGGR
jgi:hypothetical protein